jgi:hypothetical protein
VDFRLHAEGDEPSGEPVDRHVFHAPAKNLRKCGLVRAASQPLQLSATLMENPNERDQYDFSVLFRASLAGGRSGARELD